MHRVALAALLVATLACSLISESTIRSDDLLVSSQRPSLLVLAPLNQSTYAAGTTVIFHAIATDSVGVARVEFVISVPGGEEKLVYATDNPTGELAVEAILTWEAVGNQVYLASARAYRPSGVPDDPLDDIPSNEITFAFEVVPPPIIVEPDIDSNTETPPQQISTQPDLSTFPATIKESVEVPVRQGPSTEYPIIQNLAPNTTVQIVGRSLDGVWLVIQLNGAYGWVFRDTVQFTDDINSLPPVEAPPLSQ